jgi:septal ring factor EnvC (AmiA/AmiB activator)
MSDAMSDEAAENPFGMVKGMIQNMISKIEEQSRSETSHNRFCVNEMYHTEESYEEKQSTRRKLESRLETRDVDIKEHHQREVTLQKEIATLESEQQKSTELRTKERAIYTKNLPEIERSLEGVRRAMNIIKEYYDLRESDVHHKRKHGQGRSIIGFLEVIESDFARLEEETKFAEETQKDAFSQSSKMYKSTLSAKTTDLKTLRTSVRKEVSGRTEMRTDYKSVTEEFSSVKKYKAKLKEQCTNQGAQYEEREAQRQEELNGLKEALQLIS